MIPYFSTRKLAAKLKSDKRSQANKRRTLLKLKTSPLLMDYPIVYEPEKKQVLIKMRLMPWGNNENFISQILTGCPILMSYVRESIRDRSIDMFPENEETMKKEFLGNLRIQTLRHFPQLQLVENHSDNVFRAFTIVEWVKKTGHVDGIPASKAFQRTSTGLGSYIFAVPADGDPNRGLPEEATYADLYMAILSDAGIPTVYEEITEDMMFTQVRLYIDGLGLSL